MGVPIFFTYYILSSVLIWIKAGFWFVPLTITGLIAGCFSIQFWVRLKACRTRIATFFKFKLNPSLQNQLKAEANELLKEMTVLFQKYEGTEVI